MHHVHTPGPGGLSGAPRRASWIAGVLLAAIVVLAAGALQLSVPRLEATQGGAITGQVVWCAPLPRATGIDPVEGADTLPPAASGESLPGGLAGRVPPGAEDQVFPAPRPTPSRLIPAGAVLVAVQGTALSARTDDGGRFRLEGVPVGQYLLVAAGPIPGTSEATVIRPNVYLEADGQVVDVGTLNLGQDCRFAPVPVLR